jgi:hypothetical protein
MSRYSLGLGHLAAHCEYLSDTSEEQREKDRIESERLLIMMRIFDLRLQLAKELKALEEINVI